MTHRGVGLLKARAHTVMLSIVMVLLLIGAGPFFVKNVYGAQLTDRSMTLSSNRPGEHGVSLTVGFTSPSSGIQSFKIQFCSNSALIEDTCTPPWGFDALNTGLTGQTGTSGFIISPTSSVNEIILTHATLGSANAGPLTFSFDDIVNPTDPASYYVKVSTYNNLSATDTPVDFGAMAFAIIHGFNVQAEVPPYLIFCQAVRIDDYNCNTAAGDQIGLGALSPARTSTATSKILAATNAESGYAIFMNGFTMTSGNNLIPALTGGGSSPGVSQFGVNLRANNNPGVGENPVGPGTAAPTAPYNSPNSFRFVNGERLATATGVQDFKKFTISYIVNVNKDQAPGVYSTTLTYVCVANF